MLPHKTSDWNLQDLKEIWTEIEKIAVEELKMDLYPNQIEIVTAEQLIDSMTNIGLPLGYNHWKFGKEFVKYWENYKKGSLNLSYEMIINSDPCISYNMEENTYCLMVLVLAHAAAGHNFVFKNNYLFKDWTDASAIVPFMEYAQKYIHTCEEKYGWREVETFLDKVHAIEDYGISLYKKKHKTTKQKEEEIKKIIAEGDKWINPIWKTLPVEEYKKLTEVTLKEEYINFPETPEENMLYFLEKYSPILKPWQKEIVRIVRKKSEYFYPQTQDKIVHEGAASWTHHYIVHRLYDKGFLTEGFMVEFAKHHSNVLFQPTWEKDYYSGFNPYYLGFEIITDAVRVAKGIDVDDEDRQFYKYTAIGKNWVDVFHDLVKNYKDETLILSWLGPRVIKKLKLFTILSTEELPMYVVGDICDYAGYERIRQILAESRTRFNYIPNLEIVKVNITGDRKMTIRYTPYKDRVLSEKDTEETIWCLEKLWGFTVEIIDDKSNRIVSFDGVQYEWYDDKQTIKDDYDMISDYIYQQTGIIIPKGTNIPVGSIFGNSNGNKIRYQGNGNFSKIVTKSKSGIGKPLGRNIPTNAPIPTPNNPPVQQPVNQQPVTGNAPVSNPGNSGVGQPQQGQPQNNNNQNQSQSGGTSTSGGVVISNGNGSSGSQSSSSNKPIKTSSGSRTSSGSTTIVKSPAKTKSFLNRELIMWSGVSNMNSDIINVE